ncbi:hypothetical protein NZD89_18045 [Alicyclobacillus fastidiosus]|uniref:Transposase IS111A/IS1328/IS1533 N-terminal domain-containing protein n=1 Tax=Alicyclobacillus fastidiosus TaxID=392011 RepID=A0ABY6ZDQ6_9BACL|nr:hypothetical protein [Alicyclobacillus fastidiosus]WAH40265.1 hypothetical protein NZD89_18045 [Alicyclobacillus fastidiosus]GMA61635.1 hypothetical protein GCM10025859_20750 [Alicyclobacillus fastidiosus]
MKTITKFVGLDVSKENIAVAVADEGRGEPRYIGMFPHTVEAVRSLVHRLSADGVKLEFCYEAGPTGYGLYRLLAQWTCRVPLSHHPSFRFAKETE